MASNTLSRREAIRQMLALPLVLSLGYSTANAQTPTPSPKISALEAATKKDPILKEKVYFAAENIKNATLNITHEAYVPPISQPSDFDYHEGGMGVLLRPLNSRNTYFASCAHAWNFDLAEHGGIEKTIEAASRRGIVNPTREQIKERFKIAGYEVASQNMIGFDKKLEFSVLNVTDIMPQLAKVGTPLSIDLSHEVSNQVGDKVHWLSESQNGFPFVESNIRYASSLLSPFFVSAILILVNRGVTPEAVYLDIVS